MRLYATVVGMKNGKYVEKGQGSNQSLTIEILAEGLKDIPTRSNVYRLMLNVGNDNELEAEILDYATGKSEVLTKGKQQKDEKHCPHQPQSWLDGGGICTLCTK